MLWKSGFLKPNFIQVHPTRRLALEANKKNRLWGFCSHLKNICNTVSFKNFTASSNFIQKRDESSWIMANRLDWVSPMFFQSFWGFCAFCGDRIFHGHRRGKKDCKNQNFFHGTSSTEVYVGTVFLHHYATTTNSQRVLWKADGGLMLCLCGSKKQPKKAVLKCFTVTSLAVGFMSCATKWKLSRSGKEHRGPETGDRIFSYVRTHDWVGEPGALTSWPSHERTMGGYLFSV